MEEPAVFGVGVEEVGKEEVVVAVGRGDMGEA